jgi:2-polyprenyl-6-methoxyphenol hydroxylase-like FAD-dependent oxidoreductase
VIGASIAGLLAASALSDSGARVTVYDRDTLPAEPGPRRGVPQSRRLHARGAQVLTELLPGFRDEMVAAGAVLADTQGDAHWYLDDYLLRPAKTGLEGITLSRPVLEWLIRSRVAKLPGVTIVDGTEVAGLTATGGPATGGRATGSPETGRPPTGGRVTGVRVRAARTPDAAEETVPAALVIDAAGRGSRTPAWLAELGYPVPETSAVRAGVTYVCRLYSRDPAQLDGRFGTLVTPYPGKPRGGAVLRQEGGRFLVLLAGMVGAEPPVDEAGMLGFADSLACPDLAAVMRESAPLSDPVKYTYPESAWHHYETLSAYLGGLLVIGDAYSSFNPIYGQGMTVAALEALALRGLLSEAAGPGTAGAAGPGTSGAAGPGALTAATAGLERRYFRAAGKLVAEAWETSASSDLRFPEVAGKRRPGAGLINAYGEKYRAAASVDPVLGETFLRVANMIDKPARLLSPGHVARVFRSAGKAVRAGS